MDHERAGAGAQHALWNGAGGEAWIESREVLDRILQPFEDLLVESIPAHATRVLDVGCGTGSTTIALARRVGSGGACVGVDLSAPMIDVARARAAREAAPPAFVVADAQTHAFERATFDAVVSRFGVMFFDDPVEAFVNLRRASKSGARLLAFAWRSLEENAFLSTPERVLAPMLPSLPARRPDEPGQYAFADRERVRRILTSAGWSAIAIDPLDVACAFDERDVERVTTRMGPVGRALQHADEPARAKAIASIRAAVARYVHGSQVRFTSACWRIDARA